jgi:enoyl-CoA hydratase/carnithine racemase
LEADNCRGEWHGLVSEVVSPDSLLDVSLDLAGRIAQAPSTAVQSTLRTLWASRSLSPDQAIALGNVFLQLGTSAKNLAEGQAVFAKRQAGRIEWKLR